MTKPISVTTSAAILGATIGKLRKEKGMTQQELGEKVGVTASTWSRIEQGESQLSTDHLRAAARALDVEPSFIMEKSEAIEKELTSHGIKVEDIPPKVWSVSSKKLINAAVMVGGAVLAGRAIELTIPISGASLGRIVTEYWNRRK
jgi:transcriptional regulator with XRE-family HTH domain